MNYHIPVYECVLTANEQEASLILTSVTKDFFSLLKLKTKTPGCLLEEICDFKYSSWIYQAFQHLKNGNSCIKDLREINNSFWSYTLTYTKPFLKITLYPIWDVDEVNQTHNMGSVVNMPLNRFLGCFYDSLLMQYVDNQFHIISIGDDLSRYTGLKIGSPFDAVLPSMRSISSDALLKRCIEKRKPIYFLDVYTRHHRHYHLLIALIPLIHQSPFLLVGIHLLNEKEYYLMIKSANKTSDQLCEAENIGVAVFEICDGKLKKLINSNTCFERMVCSSEDFAYIYNKIIRLCCAQKGILTVPHRLGSVDYFITAIPYISANQLFIFVVPDTESKQSIQNLALLLTNREFEIAYRIFEGESIRSIAIDCGISEGTVKKNLSNIYNKLKVNNRVELVRLIYSFNS